MGDRKRLGPMDNDWWIAAPSKALLSWEQIVTELSESLFLLNRTIHLSLPVIRPFYRLNTKKSSILEHQSVKAANIQIILKFVWQLSVIAFGLRTLLQKYSLFFVLFFFFFSCFLVKSLWVLTHIRMFSADLTCWGGARGWEQHTQTGPGTLQPPQFITTCLVQTVAEQSG